MALNALRNIQLLNTIFVGCNRIRGGDALHKFFKLLCILTTLSLVIWCGYEFSKDEDISEILFQKFHEDEESIYPELTFAVPNRFNETALREYDKGFNEINYFKFLQGDDWDDKMLDVDFEKVSMRIEDYIIKTCFYETMLDNIYDDCKSGGEIHRLNQLGLVFVTLHFPTYMIMQGATIMLRSSIFYNGLRPANGKFQVFFSYPNQIYRSVSSRVYRWPVRTNESSKNYIMRFTLKSMEVLRKRQKKDNVCYNMGNYDDKIREIIVEKSGCKPTTWDTNKSEPLCTTRQSYQKMVSENFDQYTRFQRRNTTYLDPCISIEKLQIEFAEENILSNEEYSTDDEDGWFKIIFDLAPNSFKEIKQTRKYSVQGLVGNAGGYIGLCLGYAMWNVPTIILSIWNKVKGIQGYE